MSIASSKARRFHVGRILAIVGGVVAIGLAIAALLYSPSRSALQAVLQSLPIRILLVVALSFGFLRLGTGPAAALLFRLFKRQPIPSDAPFRTLLEYGSVLVLPPMLFVSFSAIGRPNTSGTFYFASIAFVGLVLIPLVWRGCQWLEILLTQFPEDELRRMLYHPQHFDKERFDSLREEVSQEVLDLDQDSLQCTIRLRRLEKLTTDMLREGYELDPNWPVKRAASRVTVSDYKRRANERVAQVEHDAVENLDLERKITREQHRLELEKTRAAREELQRSKHSGPARRARRSPSERIWDEIDRDERAETDVWSKFAAWAQTLRDEASAGRLDSKDVERRIANREDKIRDYFQNFGED